MALDTKGLSAGTLKEIQRKAEAGEQMSAPTAQKQALYDAYQKQMVDRVQASAKAGTGLSNPTDYKNKIYQDYQVAQMKTDYNSAYNVDQRNQAQIQSQQALNSQNVQNLGTDLANNSALKLKAMEELLRTQSTASLDSQIAQLGMARDAQLAELQKALNQAIEEGQVSVREAESTFNSAKQEIEAQYYNDAEKTKLYAQQQGIQGSNQGIGLMQGDQARANASTNTARSERDTRIADIKNRIAQIKNTSAIDTATANAQYNYSVADATAQSQAGLAQNLTQLYNTDMEQSNANMLQLGMSELDMNNQLYNQYLGNQYSTQQAQLAQQMQLALMAQEQKYNQQNMATQQAMTLEQFAVQHGYDLAKMSTEQKYQLEQMATNQGYTITNAMMQQSFTQDNMALQNSYDVNLANLGYAHDKNMSAIQFSNQTALNQQEYNLAQQSADRDAEREVLKEQLAYEQAVQRELKKYQPGTQEYKIKEAQLKDEMNAYLAEVHATTRYEAMAKSIYGEEAPIKPTRKTGVNLGFTTIGGESDAEFNRRMAEYEKKLKAYNEKMDSWNSMNPLGSTP